MNDLDVHPLCHKVKVKLSCDWCTDPFIALLAQVKFGHGDVMKGQTITVKCPDCVKRG